MAEDSLGDAMAGLASERACWLGELSSMLQSTQADIQFFDVNLMYILVQYVHLVVAQALRLMTDVPPTPPMEGTDHPAHGRLQLPRMPFAGVYQFSQSG